jgi:hypothetical protein
MSDLTEMHNHLLVLNKVYREKLGRKEFCFFGPQVMIEEAKEFIEFLDDSIREEKFLQKEIQELLNKFKKYGYEI